MVCERLTARKIYRTTSDPGGEHHCGRQYPDHDRAHSGFTVLCPYRRGLREMTRAEVTVRIVKYAVNSGEKYGKLTIIGEVRKVARAPEI
jgi:hypothetical protein